MLTYRNVIKDLHVWKRQRERRKIPGRSVTNPMSRNSWGHDCWRMPEECNPQWRRTIVSWGRWPTRCPSGIRVDPRPCLRLPKLMRQTTLSTCRKPDRKLLTKTLGKLRSNLKVGKKISTYMLSIIRFRNSVVFGWGNSRGILATGNGRRRRFLKRNGKLFHDLNVKMQVF